MSALPTETDVLVVGAGPAGLAASAVLSARGIDHLTVDPHPLDATTSRAAVVHARTLEVLDGIGVADRLVERGVVVPTFTVRDRDSVLVRVGFEDLPTRYPYTLMVPQVVTEQVLAQRLTELGGEVHAGWRLDRFDRFDPGDTTADPAAGGVVAELLDDRGERATVRARWVVGADGMHSTVRTQAGIAFAGEAYPQSFVLADVRMDWTLPDDEVQLFFSPAGLVVVAPLPGGHHRVVATVDEAPPAPDAEFVSALLRDRGPSAPARIHEVAWGSRFRVHHRLAQTYRRGPVFLAGDAAHVHSPAGGQGMNIGIQDAVDLGERLARGDLDSPDGPAGYEAARRPVAQGVVALTDRMTRAATLRGPAARARNLVLRGAGALPPVRRRLAMTLSELDTAQDRSRPRRRSLTGARLP
jgi:2-polyprenyl-6-methoxyphenol hydroxylase-like FAD-dependent oxidoreductase